MPIDMPRVFDSSAVLAFLFKEPGAELIQEDLPGGILCAVNAAEVLAVLARNGVPVLEAKTALMKTGLMISDFSMGDAVKTAELLSPQLRERGISLGDRACMAIAVTENLPVVTADRNWAGLSVTGLRVELIRD